MEQHRWTITFNGDASEAISQGDMLRDLLREAAPSDISVSQAPSSAFTQGDWVSLIATIVTSGAAVAALNALRTFFKSTHGASITIKVEGLELESGGMTNKNYERTLQFIEQQLTHQAQVNTVEKKEP